MHLPTLLSTILLAALPPTLATPTPAGSLQPRISGAAYLGGPCTKYGGEAAAPGTIICSANYMAVVRIVLPFLLLLQQRE
ncbi:hypothetical protein ABVK25_006339 [Lepraria finkii]|uniref:Uncharacterized protein n=1 Tax=Lepraria finkii TaxID=1340010 RepID=A0ABR4B658_9LECA